MLREELLKLLEELTTQRRLNEAKTARELQRYYEEARKTLYARFLDAQARHDVIEMHYINGIIQDLTKQMRYYDKLVVEVRQSNIDKSFILGQTIGLDMLRAGGFKITAKFGVVNHNMVRYLLGNIPELAGNMSDKTLLRVRDELVRGALLGESIPKIANRILGTGLTQDGLIKPFVTLRKRAETIARTETIKASDAGYEDAMVKAQKDIPEEIYDAWITAGDDRVESECRAIARGNDPRFKSVKGLPGVYPRDAGPRPVIHTHPNCRCRRIPYLKSWHDSGAFRVDELKGRK